MTVLRRVVQFLRNVGATRRTRLALLLVLTACAQRPAGGPIPLARDGLVAAVVGGVPVHLVLDTGATGTIVRHEAMAARAGQLQRWAPGAAKFHDARGVVAELADFLPDAVVALGGVEVHVPVLALLPREAAKATEVVRFVPARDGLLGMDVLRRLVLWVDFPRQQLRVLAPEELDAALRAAGRTVAQRVPLAGSEREPRIRVQLEGTDEVQLLLDTGAERTSLPPGTAARLGLRSGAHLVHGESLDVVAADGTVLGKYTTPAWDGSEQGWLGARSGPRPLFHLPRLALGPHVVRDLPVTESDRAPALGRDVLARFDWIWHGPRNELLLLSAR